MEGPRRVLWSASRFDFVNSEPSRDGASNSVLHPSFGQSGMLLHLATKRSTSSPPVRCSGNPGSIALVSCGCRSCLPRPKCLADGWKAWNAARRRSRPARRYRCSLCWIAYGPRPSAWKRRWTSALTRRARTHPGDCAYPGSDRPHRRVRTLLRRAAKAASVEKSRPLAGRGEPDHPQRSWPRTACSASLSGTRDVKSALAEAGTVPGSLMTRQGRSSPGSSSTPTIYQIEFDKVPDPTVLASQPGSQRGTQRGLYGQEPSGGDGLRYGCDPHLPGCRWVHWSCELSLVPNCQ